MALAVCARVAWSHPTLRLVDFLGFNTRARALPADLLHPLYPVGYPALLRLGTWFTGDALMAGKGLAVLAGALAVAAAARLLGVSAGLWLLAQVGLLTYAATEGTDLPAVALTLAALAAAGASRPVGAGVLLGLACLCRYTAVVALPAVLWLVPSRGRMLVAFALATSPHWATALYLGRSALPDQSENLVIAQGRPDARLLSVETLRILPWGVARAWGAAVQGWPTWLGVAGVGVGLLRRDRRAAGLGLWAGAHILLVGLAFANERLVLAATLAFSLGAPFLLPRWLLGPLAGLLLWQVWGPALTPTEEEARLAEVVEVSAGLPGPWLSSSPWFYEQDGAWLRGSVPIRAVVGDPRRLGPVELGRLAREGGYRHLALDRARIVRTYPGLKPLLQAGGERGGLIERGRTKGWIVFEVPD